MEKREKNSFIKRLVEVSTLISKGKIEEGLNILLEIGKDLMLACNEESSLCDDIILLQSRLSTIDRQLRKGILTLSDYNTEKTRIEDSTLFTKTEIIKQYKLEKEANEQKEEEVQEKQVAILKELAKELAFNYLNVTFTDRYKENDGEIEYLVIEEAAKKIFKEDSAKDFNNANRGERKCRNVLVIGAGATYDVFNIFPHGEEMKKELKKSLNVDRLRKNDKGNKDDIFDSRFESAETLEFENGAPCSTSCRAMSECCAKLPGP